MENDVTSQAGLAQTSCRWLIESAPDGIVIVNSDGRIVLVNEQAEKLFAYTESELLGHHIEVLIPERFREDHLDYRTGYMTAPKTRPMGIGLELYGRRRDGSEFPVEIKLSPIKTEQGLLVMAIVRDVTEFRREHYISSTLQKSLLPPIPDSVDELTVASSYHSAYTGAQIGGDFFDVLSLGDGLTGVTIGDVSGKGVESAVRTALGKYTVRAYAYVDPEPSHVAERANAAVYRQIGADSFITLFYGLVSARTDTLTYVNAGHMPPLCLHCSDTGTERLASGNPPLGVLPSVEYRQISIPFQPGDRVLLYTDGVTEARDGKGFFGLDRLRSYFISRRDEPPMEFVSNLTKHLEEWSDEHLRDDVAILLISR